MNLAVSIGVDRKAAGYPVSFSSETSQKPHLPRSGYIYKSDIFWGLLVGMDRISGHL